MKKICHAVLRFLTISWKRLVIPLLCGLPFHSALAALHYQSIQTERGDAFDVIEIDDLANLKLFLKHDKQYHQSFQSVRQSLATCEQLAFAMNAGMFHPGFSPVGLYIEQGHIQQQLNHDTGFGNFFLQPNGVLAWNSTHAVISSTEDYQKQDFAAEFATQSGPMLVINGNINPLFLADSDSRKVRNGVGVKENRLYFVISKNRVNFYQFAAFFQKQLGIQQALYLDGSISSLYLPQIGREDRRFDLGPMVGWVNTSNCPNASNPQK